MARTRFVETVKPPVSGREKYADAALPRFGFRLYAGTARGRSRCAAGSAAGTGA